MKAERAAELVVEKYPGRFPIGYWEHDDGVIIQTKPFKSLAGMTVPAQFLVTSNGEILGVNPVRYNLSKETMKKF